MLRTLGSLVVSMTGTAALLGWIAPDRPPPPTPLPLNVVLAEARSAVLAGVDVTWEPWAGIELQAAPFEQGAKRVLTAHTGSAQAHFVVDAEGRCNSSDLWRRQLAGPDGSADIRVRLLQQSPGEPMSDNQWAAIRALVSELNLEMGLAETMPVYFNAEFGDLYGLAPGTALPPSVLN